MGFEHVYITNAFKCHLPNDRKPRRAEYDACFSEQLVPQIKGFAPNGIVSFGPGPTYLLFPELKSVGEITPSVGLTMQALDRFPTYISFHPGHLHRQPRETRFNSLYPPIIEFMGEHRTDT